MPPEDHFKKADATIEYITEHVTTLNDGILMNQFSGFCAVTAVTVYELAIKDIFIEFAKNKHRVFGGFVEQHFRKVNGRIMYSDLVKLSSRFGSKYKARFSQKVENKEQQHLRTARRSIKSSYGNIVTWRNQFAHGGILPSNATLAELARAYDDGKHVIFALHESMRR